MWLIQISKKSIKYLYVVVSRKTPHVKIWDISLLIRNYPQFSHDIDKNEMNNCFGNKANPSRFVPTEINWLEQVGTEFY